jgi:phage terminase large subunit
MISLQSLRALPPKQALALALAEQARRKKIKQARIALLDDSGSLSRDNEERMPEIPHGTSLVLDRDHVFSDLWYPTETKYGKRVRYRVFWGGRGSGKSWAIAEALIRKAAAVPLRVLCLREIQNTMRDSSHKVLSDTIRRLGLESWFNITATSITSKVGSEFMFKGCFGNIDGIRSMEGIDLVWAEEAHSIAEASWRVIIPTIRKPGSEIWISFNMDSEEDATYRRFVAPNVVRENVICHKVNFDANPYFSDELREEMEFDRDYDYELYEHVWLGMPKKVSDAIVLNRKYKVVEFDDDLWRRVNGYRGQPCGPATLRYGMDFGTTDPTALTRSFVLEEWDEEKLRNDQILYVSHELYGSGIELDDLAEGMDSVPGVREWPIGADAAAPGTISFLKKRGFRIYGAEKWQGSVEDGIRYLRGFKEIRIHKRCPNTAKEAFLWRWKTDPKRVDAHGQPLVLPVLVQGNEHAWDSVRYGHDGQIQKGGPQGVWERLGKQSQEQERQH